MKRLTGLILITCISGCQSNNGTHNTASDTATVSEVVADNVEHTEGQQLNDGHNAQNALDWAGTYEGLIPCADCPGINTKITLQTDNTYTKTQEYIGKDNGTFTETGKIIWQKNGNVITLVPAEGTSTMYKVTEGNLVMLDMQGNEIKGILAVNYILKKL